MTPVAARLVRWLNMIPYFQANPRVSYAKAASDLGVNRRQLQQDINLLWMCGLPGYYPGDLIDFVVEVNVRRSVGWRLPGLPERVAAVAYAGSVTGVP